MSRSFLSLLLYSIIAIRFYATPQDENPSKEDIWAHRLIGILITVIILSCIPWFVSEISENSAIWPEILHDVVVGSILLMGLLVYLLSRHKK